MRVSDARLHRQEQMCLHECTFTVLIGIVPPHTHARATSFLAIYHLFVLFRFRLFACQVRVTHLPAALLGTPGLFRVVFSSGNVEAGTTPKEVGPDGSVEWSEPLEIIVHNATVTLTLMASVLHSVPPGRWTILTGMNAGYVTALSNEWSYVHTLRPGPNLYARLSVEGEYGTQRAQDDPVKEVRATEARSIKAGRRSSEDSKGFDAGGRLKLLSATEKADAGLPPPLPPPKQPHSHIDFGSDIGYGDDSDDGTSGGDGDIDTDTFNWGEPTGL